MVYEKTEPVEEIQEEIEESEEKEEETKEENTEKPEEKEETNDDFIDVYEVKPINYHKSLSKALIKSTGCCLLTSNIEPLDVSDIKNSRRVKVISGLKYELNCKNTEEATEITVKLGEFYKNLDKLRIYTKIDGELVDITDDVVIYNEDGETFFKYMSSNSKNLVTSIYIGEKLLCYWWIVIIIIVIILLIIRYRNHRRALNN